MCVRVCIYVVRQFRIPWAVGYIKRCFTLYRAVLARPAAPTHLDMDAPLAEDREVDFYWYLDNPFQYNFWRIKQNERITLHSNDPRGIELEVFRLADLITVPETHMYNVSRYLRSRECSVGRTVVTYDELVMIPKTRLTAVWKDAVALCTRPTYGCIYRRLVGDLPEEAEDSAPTVSDAVDHEPLVDNSYPEDSEMDT